MLLQTTPSIRRAASRAPSPEGAVAELHAGLAQEQAALTVFFASPEYDTEALATALRKHFQGTPLIGCTTAGEIGPAGYHTGGLTGFSLSSKDFRGHSSLIGHLKDLEPDQGKAQALQAMSRMQAQGKRPDGSNTFGFLLVDGLSIREEALVSSLHKPLGDIPLFGGSAGDNLRFKETLIWAEGTFHRNAAVLNLIQTDLPFEVFRTQHFVESDQKMVVTEADPIARVVKEINGEPAALEYARMVGVPATELTPTVFSEHPVVLRVSGEYFVRSIAKAHADHSLSFYCAIESGVVLTLARGVDMVAGLKNAFQRLHATLGPVQLTIGCDCILRSLECDAKGVREQVAAILEENHTIGFATYGEQINAMHVNQTLTGVCIGQRRE